MTAGHSPRRVRQAHVEWVADRLGARDRLIIEAVSRLRLATGAQLERLHFADIAPTSRARVRRRVLARLVTWRVLLTLDRRIGGVRAGSAGLVFALDSTGLQLATRAHDGSVRRPREPGLALLGHSLTASELYVALAERSRTGGFTVADFLTEPACWQPLPGGGWLKPDAYVRLVTERVADHWWIEVDKATEHLPTIRRKLAAFLDYADAGGLGPSGVLPRVLVTVPTTARQEAVLSAIQTLGTQAQALLHVSNETAAPEYLLKVLRS